MIFLGRDDQGMLFRIRRREERVLLALFDRYPLIDSSYFELSKSVDPEEIGEDRRLLEETLATEKLETKRWLKSLLVNPDRSDETKIGWVIRLNEEEAERLLQVLNELRVGSWIALGRPDDYSLEGVELNQETAAALYILQISTGFEHQLLMALAGGEPESGGTDSEEGDDDRAAD